MQLLKHLIRHMGLRYLFFRAWYELYKKIGLLELRFKKEFKVRTHISVDDWRNTHTDHFFFRNSDDLKFYPKVDADLNETIKNLYADRYEFFNSGVNYYVPNWLVNPETGYTYSLDHWTKIPLYSKRNGDIKFVWEKSKFSYVYHFIRSDLANGTDHSERVFSDILSWVKENPVNLGPNYVCSQEIAIRVMNWTFALHFYSKSPFLTQERFNIITSSVYYQVNHVRKNINFSRIAVKNNHAVTETLILYLYGLFYPFLPQSQKWLNFGRKTFVKEVCDQIFDDGSDSQYSFNYLRVKLQLFTWAIYAAAKNGDKLSDAFHAKVRSATIFLSRITLSNGKVPIYGANDGSLYFKLNSSSFDDFRPQLIPLLKYYNIPIPFDCDSLLSEDFYWYSGGVDFGKPIIQHFQFPFIIDYPDSGYYGIRYAENGLLFIRLGNHKYRPSQADNGHIDLWHDGENILRDSGTFKYLTEDKLVKYFTGVIGHNTVSVDGEEQMERGPNFIWFNWTSVKNVFYNYDKGVYTISGTIILKGNKGWYSIKRVVNFSETERYLLVSDIVQDREPKKVQQYWHFSPNIVDRIKIQGRSFNDELADCKSQMGYFSDRYGLKTDVPYFILEVNKSKSINTVIHF
jgi:hypothetical protein